MSDDEKKNFAIGYHDTRMDPQGRAPKLPFPLTASPVKAHHPHGRVFEGTRCGQFGNPLWAVWGNPLFGTRCGQRLVV